MVYENFIDKIPFWMLFGIGISWFIYAEKLNSKKFGVKNTESVKKLIYSIALFFSLCAGLSAFLVLLYLTMFMSLSEVSFLEGFFRLWFFFCIVAFSVLLGQYKSNTNLTDFRNSIFRIISFIIMLIFLTFPFVLVSIKYSFRAIFLPNLLLAYSIIFVSLTIGYMFCKALVPDDKRRKAERLFHVFNKKNMFLLIGIFIMLFIFSWYLYPSTNFTGEKIDTYLFTDQYPSEMAVLKKYDYNVTNNGLLGWTFIYNKKMNDFQGITIIYNRSESYGQDIFTGEIEDRDWEKISLDMGIKEIKLFKDLGLLLLKQDPTKLKEKEVIGFVIHTEEKLETIPKDFKSDISFKGCNGAECRIELSINNSLNYSVESKGDFYGTDYRETLDGFSKCRIIGISGEEKGISRLGNIYSNYVNITCSQDKTVCDITAHSNLGARSKFSSWLSFYYYFIERSANLTLEYSLYCE